MIVEDHCDWLVAHRGCPGAATENTAEAIEIALRAGARWLEIDVQLTADRVPVLHHDADLRRLADRGGAVADLTAAEFAELRFEHGSPTTLAACCRLVQARDATLFVELKSAAIDRWGVDAAVAAVLREIAELGPRAVLIASNAAALRICRKRGPHAIGWILPTWSEAVLAAARDLSADYLFCNVRKVPEVLRALPELGATWVVYVVDDRDDAMAWRRRGADLVETDELERLLA